MPKLSELITKPTRAELLEKLLNAAQELGLTITDWNPGGDERTFLEIDSFVLEDVFAVLTVITEGGYLDLAEDLWLDALAEDFYAVLRNQATFASGVLKLTCEPGFGPYTIDDFQLWAGTANGKRFNTLTGGTLIPGGTLTLNARAESPGSDFNVPIGAINILHTPLPGVTVTNEANWLLSAGTDTETDDSLRSRCRLQWSELSTTGPRDAYDSFARKARKEVKQVLVRDQNPRGPGTVDVVVWGQGGIGVDVVADVNTYIQPRRPVKADVLVYGATPVVIPVFATITVKIANRSSAQAAGLANLTKYQNSLPIHPTVYRAKLIDALVTPDGVTDVQLTQPATDQILGIVEAAVFEVTATNFTWIEV